MEFDDLWDVLVDKWHITKEQLEDKVLEQNPGEENPQLSQDYIDGWYDKLEALQGNKNTYYAGEIISFGDMEDTCAASKDIIGRFF